MRRNKIILFLLTVVLSVSTSPFETYADSMNSNPTITQYIESFTNDLLNDLDSVEIEGGQAFNQTFNVSSNFAQSYYATTVKYKTVVNNEDVEVNSTIRKDNNDTQSHNFTINKGNEVNQFGSGRRYKINDHQFVFKTTINEANNMTGMTNFIAQEVILVDTNEKKAYQFTTTMYYSDENSNEPVTVKVITQIFNYTSDLYANDYASLYFANKIGTTKETNFSIDKKDFINTYHVILNGYNVQPIYFNTDENRPYIYAYEVLSQISTPNWELNVKTPFMRHLTQKGADEDMIITNQQIADMQKPFQKESNDVITKTNISLCKTIRLVIGQKEIIVNGVTQSLDVSPFIKSNNTLVPVRFVSESLDAEVLWDGDDNKVTINKENDSIILTLGSNIASVNGNSVKLDLPPQLSNGRTMVPLRFVSENLKATVKWNDADQSITITSNGCTPMANAINYDKITND